MNRDCTTALQPGWQNGTLTLKKNLRLGTVAHAYNPSTLGSQGRKTTWGQEFEANITKLISTKNTKISQAWWHMPVVPANQEAEAGESLERGRQRLQWAEIVSLPSSLGNRVRLCLKKKKRKEGREGGRDRHLKGYVINSLIWAEKRSPGLTVAIEGHITLIC